MLFCSCCNSGSVEDETQKVTTSILMSSETPTPTSPSLSSTPRNNHTKQSSQRELSRKESAKQMDSDPSKHHNKLSTPRERKMTTSTSISDLKNKQPENKQVVSPIQANKDYRFDKQAIVNSLAKGDLPLGWVQSSDGTFFNFATLSTSERYPEICNTPYSFEYASYEEIQFAVDAVHTKNLLNMLDIVEELDWDIDVAQIKNLNSIPRVS